MYSPWHDWDSTLVTNRVMDSGIHRISLIYTVPTKETISTMMGFEVEQLGTNFLPKPPRNFVSFECPKFLRTPPPVHLSWTGPRVTMARLPC